MVSFRGSIQNFRRASPSVSYGSLPPGNRETRSTVHAMGVPSLHERLCFRTAADLSRFKLPYVRKPNNRQWNHVLKKEY